MLGRDTKWRQGCVLNNEDAHALGLLESLESGKCAIVISHDCDLPHKEEKFVEVIVGTVVPKHNSMFTDARHPRCLHLRFSTLTDEQKWVELRHADKHSIDKQQFAELKGHDHSFIISHNQKRTLMQWLAIRYGRQAFPTTFDERLRQKIGRKTVSEQIDLIVKPISTHLVGLYFDLGGEMLAELPGGEPYNLSISVVYDANEGGSEAKKIAEETAEGIKKLFHSVYGPAKSAKEIALEECNAIADTFMTLADLRRVDQWRLEYISLGEDPVGEYIAPWELPA